MASEQTERAQPPASLASSDLSASQRTEQEEREAARWPDTSLWPPRCAGGHRGTQKDAERCRSRGTQRDAGIGRRRQVLTGSRGSMGTPKGKGTPCWHGAM